MGECEHCLFFRAWNLARLATAADCDPISYKLGDFEGVAEHHFLRSLLRASSQHSYVPAANSYVPGVMLR